MDVADTAIETAEPALGNSKADEASFSLFCKFP